MCGIVGYAGSQLQSETDWIENACNVLAHRGPDDIGHWYSPNRSVAFGHRRLAILDLSSAGHQPMHLKDRSYSIVFNGEIYNYKSLRTELVKLGFAFSSNSDTEVLLAAYAAWGDSFLSRLNGMFALAIYDGEKDELLIARDRAGEKPLFYYISPRGILFFASELKALLVNPNLPSQIDLEAMDCFLAMGYVPGERCILAGYRKLPPAHSLKFSLKKGTAQIWRYWNLPELSVGATEATTEELVHELASLLESAVGQQLIADVPVGVLLSGGVDSSLITAMAVRHSPNVKTFSIAFPGHGKYDESFYAKKVANYFGTVHTELIAEPTTADVIPRLAAQFDEPLIDSSMIPTWLVTQLVKKHCTVALGGDGGDELFGGYDHHRRLIRLHQNTWWIPRIIRKTIAESATRLLPTGFKGRNWIQSLSTNFSYELPLIANYFDRNARNKLLNSLSDLKTRAEHIFLNRVPREEDLLQRATRMDLQNYLPEDILVKVDRASMLNSLEMRAPFLDYRIIEFAFSKVPSRLKTSGTQRKILLRHLCKDLLPTDFDSARKQGFGIPIASWLQSGPFRELFWDTLQQNGCVFDRDMIKSLLAGQDKHHRNGERLFGLVLFEIWRRTYSISV